MKPQRRWPCHLIVLLLWAASGLVQGQAAGTEQLGQVHFRVACSTDVQQEFDRGVALLHSFAFDASAKAFAAVAQQDASCSMAHWGVAMTRLGNPFNWPPGAHAIQEGWAAVEKAKAAGGKTPREQGYIAAIEVLYKDAEKIDHRTRALAYERAMEQLSRTYPDDREAVIFYALALNATALPTDKTYANQLKAAEILEPIFAEQPNHPGVAHYLIHSYDYAPIAHRGLAAARKDLMRLQELRDALAEAKLGYWQEQVAIQHQVVTAWMALAEGKPQEALQLMHGAADRENASDKATVTPGPIIPARELLGEMFLAINEPQPALQAFEASMQIEPHRFWGLYGAAQAAELMGDRDKARTFSTQLLALAERADSDRPALAATRGFLAQQ